MSRTSEQYKYRHDEEAGGHADVFKHTVLCAAIRQLQEMHPEGIVLVDAHCGYGIYDLPPEKKTAPFQKGVMKVLEAYEGPKVYEIPNPVKDYVKLLLETTGSDGRQDFELYPGSAVLGQALLREGLDEHRLCDLHVERVEGLRKGANFERIDSFDIDNLEWLVPDSPKPAVLLLDPPYEDQEHFVATKRLLENILLRDPYATVLVWVPMIHGSRFRWDYPKSLKEIAKNEARVGRYYANMTVQTTGLMGSGMLIVNPTKDFDEVIDEKVVHWLANTMNQGKDEYMVEQYMKKFKTITT